MSEIRGVDGMSRPLEAKDIRGLAGTLSGSVLEPADPGTTIRDGSTTG